MKKQNPKCHNTQVKTHHSIRFRQRRRSFSKVVCKAKCFSPSPLFSRGNQQVFSSLKAKKAQWEISFFEKICCDLGILKTLPLWQPEILLQQVWKRWENLRYLAAPAASHLKINLDAIWLCKKYLIQNPTYSNSYGRGTAPGPWLKRPKGANLHLKYKIALQPNYCWAALRYDTFPVEDCEVFQQK